MDIPTTDTEMIKHCHEVGSVYWPVTRNRTDGWSIVTWASNGVNENAEGTKGGHGLESVFLLWKQKGDAG